jgi:pantoate--beta-alanine ligase
MEIIRTIAEFRRVRDEARTRGALGLVPTMGYLHNGHLELVRRARADNGVVAASIFVNPTQFGPTEDLAAYPRDFDRDKALLEAAGCDLLFYPSAEEMYPLPAVDVHVIPGRVAAVLEGAIRPGHLRGVATVVTKLFNIVQPQRAYFGQKDGQQVAVIKRMVLDLDMPVEIVVVPTVREEDGLAMSSRNSFLSSPERSAAAVLYQALQRAERLYDDGTRAADALRAVMQETLASEPLAEVDYVSIADPETLEELERVEESGAMASLAVRIGRTRLIDNVLLGDAAHAG